MPRRHLLTERQRASLFDLPTDDASILRYYTLADDDLEHIKKRRRTENKLGFALHLCALRYPGRTLIPGEVIPEKVISFVGAQLGIPADKLETLCYATRRQTHQEHMDALRALYDYSIFSGHIALSLREWLTKEAEVAQSSENLIRRFIEKCRCERVILPAMSTIERLCADKLIAAEKRMEKTITGQLSEENKEKLNALLVEKADDSISRFIWLRHHDAGSNSAEANRLLDRLEFLQNLGVNPCTVLNIPPHWVTRFRRQGERYFTDGLQDIKGDRKFAILAVCVVEWQAAIADSIVETHDRIVGRTWNEAKKSCGAHMEESRPVARDTLKAFLSLGKSLIHARDSCKSLDEAVLDSASGWDGLRRLVSQAEHLTDALEADPMAYVVQGYYRFRLYVPRMLRLLDIQYSPSASALIEAVTVLKERQQNRCRPTSFLRPTSKWHRHLKTYPSKDSRLWEVSVFFHLREAFRSGDIWLKTSRRYSDLTEVLVPATTVTTAHQLAVPLDPRAWLADRKAEMINGLKRLAKAARTDCIPNGSIENGSLSLTRLEAKPPEGAEDLTLDLYRCLPEVRITDILLDVDGMLGFTDSFTHLRTGSPCTDKIGLLNVLLAEGLNLGLRKMAEASDTHDYWQLSRLARWHIEEEALNRALAKVVEAQSRLAISRTWGAGLSASSDGQFFQTTRQGEAMNLINSRYGNQPGIKAYTHLSDQFAPFSVQTIPSTVSEAPYILDGLLMNEAGQQIREQYADTGGFTDHVFAITSILGYQFVPRIRDLASKKLYVFDLRAIPREIKELVGGKINEERIVTNWTDILRCAVTMATGKMPPSQILSKLAAYPRQHDLAVALRDIGRIERTLFIINWVLDLEMQRRAQIGLNKGEAHHALKNALRIGRQGEIRDRTTEGQHYRMAGLNLLTAIVIYWNSFHLSLAIEQRKKDGNEVSFTSLKHVSPLGWAHILLTGEYRWSRK